MMHAAGIGGSSPQDPDEEAQYVQMILGAGGRPLRWFPTWIVIVTGSVCTSHAASVASVEDMEVPIMIIAIGVPAACAWLPSALHRNIGAVCPANK